VNEQQAERLEKTTQQQEELAAQARQQFEELQRFKREQQQFETSIAKLIEEQRRSLASFASEQGERAAALALGQQHAESLISEHQRHLSSFITEEQEQLSRIYAQLEHFQKLIDTQSDTAAATRAELKQESTELVTRAEEMNAAREVQLELLAKELRAELAHVFSKQQEIRAELVLQAQRANVLLDKAHQALAEPGTSDYVAAMAGEGEHTLDAFYLTLEEQFRGSRAEIKDRLRIYLPLIAGAGIGSSQKPILDVGCGRGEWLELLKENGVRARGIDSNRMQVARSLEFGVDVAEAELLTHLRAMDDSSLGAVTGFHIVEHLPMETLVAFLDETVRVVQPGGLVIFETPNPENVLVGSCNFYFDPTHRNPLPAPVLKFLVESRGYQDVQILKLNPSDEARVEGDTDVAKRFNQYFYGPMDYAVVGRRGRTDDDAALSAKR
jgi:O-antigen chain-terminating methyltransferase